MTFYTDKTKEEIIQGDIDRYSFKRPDLGFVLEIKKRRLLKNLDRVSHFPKLRKAILEMTK